MTSILSVIIVLMIVSALYSIPFICAKYNILVEIVPLHEVHKFNSMKASQQCEYLINKYLTSDEYKQLVRGGWTIAFKGFKSNMTCLGFEYKEGNTYTHEGEPIPCKCGFHACLYPKDVATYYSAIGDKYHIVFLKGFAKNQRSHWDSKVCANTIKIGPRISHRYITE